MPRISKDEILQLFAEEITEALILLEEALLALEDQPSNLNRITEIMRIFHTIKGGAGLCKQPELAEYALQAESLMELFYSRQLVVTPQMISILFQSIDCLKSFVAHIKQTDSLDTALIKQSLESMKRFTRSDLPDAMTVSPQITSEESTKQASYEKRYFFHLKFPADFLKGSNNGMRVFQELKQLGELIVIPHPGTAPTLRYLEPFQLHLEWSVQLTTEKPLEAIENCLHLFFDKQAIQIEPVERASKKGPPLPIDKKRRLPI